MPILIKGADLDSRQREQVLAAFVYRWTSDNRHRAHVYGTCPVCKVPGGEPEPTLRREDRMLCRKFHPVLSLTTDQKWLEDHSFWFLNDGSRLAQARKYAHPAYMADTEQTLQRAR